MKLDIDLRKRRVAKAQQKDAKRFIKKVLRANRSRNFLGNSGALITLMGKTAMHETLMEKVARVHKRQRLERVIAAFLSEGDNLEKMAALERAGTFMPKLRTAGANLWAKLTGKTVTPRVPRGKLDPNYSPTPEKIRSVLRAPPSARNLERQRRKWEATATPGQRMRAALKRAA